MSSFVNNFNIFRNFPKELKQNIKLFHVFDDNIGYCVTNDDKVYGLGKDIRNYLNYHLISDNKSYVLIRELCDKSIVQFFGGFDSFFARSESNEIYTWGRNDQGQLARGFIYRRLYEKHLKPKNNRFFSDKNIIQFIFKFPNGMALSSDGTAYGWGDNRFKKIDPSSNEEFITTPIVLKKLNENIKSIHLYHGHLCALTNTGSVYSYFEEKYMDWDLTGEEIIDIYWSYQGNFLQTDKFLYERKDENWIKIDYKNLFEYVFLRYQLTYKTIYLSESQIFSIDYSFSEKSNELKKSLKPIDFNESELTISSTVFKDLPKTLKSDVKCFHKSNGLEFLIMNNNKVYVIGASSNGKLGLGNVETCRVFTEVSDLSGKGVEEFFEGSLSMFARTRTNDILTWGYNDFGQLGIGFKTKSEFERITPRKNEFFTDKNIMQISSRYGHCLALGSDGKVYGWGRNEWGQVGCGQGQEDSILVPVLIDFENPIKFIECCEELSFCVDINGNAFYWGITASKIINWKPMEMFAKNVKKIQKLFEKNECLILSEIGCVFVYSLNENKIIFEVSVDLKVDNIFGNYCETQECVHYINYKERVSEKMDFINIYDYFSSKLNKTHKTIHIKTEESYGQKVKYLTTKEIQLNPEYSRQTNEKLFILKDKNIFERKFQNSFALIERIGRGSFGEVFKVNERAAQDLFAVKKIEMKDQWKYNLSETKIMSQLNSDFVVQYYDSWIELDLNKSNELTKFLYIKMDLCSENLRKVIHLMNKFLKNHKIFRFFISCELLRELTKAVNYLHSNHIIHRDLKPENVVTTDGRNGVFIKLCDFNIAKVLGMRDENDQGTPDDQRGEYTRNRGTRYYIAPEIKTGIYDEKSDMFGLALIATEIFYFEDSIEKISTNLRRVIDWNKYLKTYLNTNLENNFSKLLETLKDCLQPKDQKPDNRPNCEQLLQKINEFSVDKSFLTKDSDIYDEFKLILEKRDNIFLKRFFYHKVDDKSQFQPNPESNDTQTKDKLLNERLDTLVKEITQATTTGDKRMLLFALGDLCLIIDESPIPCQVFVLNTGIDFLMNALKKFEADIGFGRVILSILFSIAQIPHLRSLLLNSDVLTILRCFIKSEDILVSYLATGLFANLYCDSLQPKYSSLIDWSQVLDELGNVVLNWNKRELPWLEYVEYTTFQTFLPLLNCFECPSVQLWAIWSIHHFCGENSERYCDMLVKEDALPSILLLLESPNDVHKNMRQLCEQTLDIVQQFLSQ